MPIPTYRFIGAFVPQSPARTILLRARDLEWSRAREQIPNRHRPQGKLTNDLPAMYAIGVPLKMISDGGAILLMATFSRLFESRVLVK